MNGIKEYIFKIVIIGDGSVGKTSMVLRYCENKFNENYIMSIGANFSIKMINKPEDNIAIRLQVWDLAGQKHFAFVRPGFYQGAFAYILVFDITRRDTFENVDNWLKEAKQNCPGVPYILVGNKIDLSDERVVSKKEGESLAEKLGAISYYETSAKDSKNIGLVFSSINDRLINDRIKSL